MLPLHQQRLDAALGNPAFPWQRRLLERFMEGRIPDALDLPTGLGKTAVLAVWLVARASGANHLPRRLVYVVDRRAVVDQATTEAEKLREWVAATPQVREGLGLGEGALAISTLRGQFADNRQWCADPSAPAMVIGTVDMIGSRLLFEGYGASRKIRPFFAGLLGQDVLFVLDESHLVPAFEALIRSAITGKGLRREDPVLPPCRMLPLSATGGAYVAPLRLDADDLANPVVAQRYRAPKQVEVAQIEGSLADALANQAWELTVDQEPRRVLVFANSRKVAEQTRVALEKRLKAEYGRADKPKIILFVGGRRVFERGEASHELFASGFLAGSPAPAQHAFVIATSAGEVGVDLDADDLVGDIVPWERMVQRLGRVNRRGEGAARVRFLHEPFADGTDPKVVESRGLLRVLPEDEEGSRQGGPEALDRTKQSNLDAVSRATTPGPTRPALTRALLDSWALTSLVEHTGRPEVQPWLRGWVEEDPQTTLVWRHQLPPPSTSVSQIRDFFKAARPHLLERLQLYSWQAMEWLGKRVKKIAKDPEKYGLSGDEWLMHRLDRAGRLEESYTLAQLEENLGTREKKRFFPTISGCTLVLDARVGGLATSGLLDDKKDEPPRRIVDSDNPVDAVGFRVIERSPEESATGEWAEIFRVARAMDGERVSRWLVVDKRRGSNPNEDARAAGNPQHLTEHLDWTREQAQGICERLELPARLTDVVTIAARLHDEGKRSARWQRAFSAPGDAAYAKTRGPVNVHALDGYRHEFGSLPYAEADPEWQGLPAEDRDLVLHLIAAHHGNARPTISVTGCEDAPPSVLEARSREVALRFCALQERWGPWGLAWLEALLRSADQRASAKNDGRL